MLRAFIQHIQETTRPQIVQVEGETFSVSAQESCQLRPELDCPDTLPLQSLDALVRLVQTEAGVLAGEGEPLYITVPDHLTVRCFGRPDYGMRCHRQVWYETRAVDVPGWGEKVSLGFEEAQIALRTRFQETADTPYVQKLLSEISCGAKIVYNDNGIATTITTQKGVALQSNECIRPIVTLRPYRTFQEVEQPESIFLIRVSDRGISFTEADGGMWKLRARETVKAWLEGRLQAETEAGKVIIAL